MDDDEDDASYYFEMRIQIDPLTKDVALMVTDHAEEDELIHPCLEKSAGFLAKPFEDEDLIGMIDEIFTSPDSWLISTVPLNSNCFQPE